MIMNHPLLIKTILDRACRLFPKKEIYSRCLEKDYEYNYGAFYKRVCRLANVLQKLGVKQGDVVGTFAWNTHRHMELYFAVTCLGAVLHTVNVRLFTDQLTYIINHAEDKLLFIDRDLLPIVEEVAENLETVQNYIIMTEPEELPETSLDPVLNYEKLLENAPDDFIFPDDLDENTTAALCYTSATTGLPKGVRYTHRAIYLHALTLSTPDAIGISEKDAVLAVVPMFHVFSWGFPFAAALMGSKLILPGNDLSPPALCGLIEQERATLVAGVPTIWNNIYRHLESGAEYDLSSLRYILNGGAAISRFLVEAFEKKYGIAVRGTFGMTEATPVAITCPIKSYLEGLPEDEKFNLKTKQGMLLPGLEMKVIDDDGNEIKWDDREMGELLLRGPWIASEYYKDPERSAETFKNGWYHSGDIVSVDEEGYVTVQDRAKDLIKSGGEWISSLDLENKIMAHPAVEEAAIIAIPDIKWQERPLACIVLKANEKDKIDEQDILNFLQDKVAKFWIPDRVVFVEEVPKTSVGKFNKNALRDRFSGTE